MRKNSARLYFFCGKMAAGKSTLAKELARTKNAVLLVQDEFLAKLFPGEIRDIPDFVKYSSRVKEALTPLIQTLLLRGTAVVLDFPGNTRNQRAWFRELLEQTKVEHELHFVDVPDEVCKRQLRERSKDLPASSSFTTDAEFYAITAYFQPPGEDEEFNVIHHPRA
jgi:predicted kinase